MFCLVNVQLRYLLSVRAENLMGGNEHGKELTLKQVLPVKTCNLLCSEQLPRFFQLCSDNVWGVRKACAECFMAVSCATSQEVRRTKLSTLFINLISDPSRWVRNASYFLNSCSVQFSDLIVIFYIQLLPVGMGNLSCFTHLEKDSCWNAWFSSRQKNFFLFPPQHGGKTVPPGPLFLATEVAMA